MLFREFFYLLQNIVIFITIKEKMERNIIINNFLKLHSDWLKAVGFNLTGDITKAEDLVQDSLLKILELSDERFVKILYGKDDINTYWFYVVMKNAHINQNKAKKEIETNPDDFADSSSIDTDLEFEDKNEALMAKIRQRMEDMEKDEDLFFDSLLLKTYIEEGHSMQSLAKATKISVSTIFTSLKRVKTHLSESFHQDYTNLKN